MRTIAEILGAAQANEEVTTEELGGLADAAKTAEVARLAADKAAAKLKEDEVLLKTTLTALLLRNKIKAVGGSTYKVEITQDDVPTVKDWPKFYAYIVKNKAFDLLERRPGKAAIKVRWEDGKQVPGVDKFVVDKLSFTKLKG